MKIITTPTANFISDLKLESNDGAVSFDALIKFTSNNKKIELLTEVQIISTVAKGRDTICLLNPDIAANKIPDIFNSDTTIVYEGEALSVTGYSEEYGHYNLKIFPQPISVESWENGY